MGGFDARRVGDVHACSHRGPRRRAEPFDRPIDRVLITPGQRDAEPSTEKLTAGFEPESSIRTSNHSHSLCHVGYCRPTRAAQLLLRVPRLHPRLPDQWLRKEYRMHGRLLLGVLGTVALVACSQSDAAITANVKSKLIADEVVKARIITVDTQDKV